MKITPPVRQCGVYMIRNIYTKKVYIGSSIQLTERWRHHRKGLEANRHHSPALQNAWNKYGSDAFEVFTLSYCDSGTLRDEEQYWLRFHSSQLNGTRDVKGGRRRRGHTSDSREKQSRASKALWATPEFRSMVTSRMKGAKKKSKTALEAERLGISYQLLNYRIKKGYISV